MYVDSFDGLIGEPKKQQPKEKEAEAEDKEEESGGGVSLEKTREQVESNVSANVEFLKKEGEQVVKNVQRNTGIYSREELRAWAESQMKLANECLGEFMAGYRQGRDDEMDKMMNEYFQDDDEEEEEEDESSLTKRQRRKPKRRIRIYN